MQRRHEQLEQSLEAEKEEQKCKHAKNDTQDLDMTSEEAERQLQQAL